MTKIRNHGSRGIGLWVNMANHPGISLYERVGFCRTDEVAPLPSDPTQQEVRMLRNG